MKMIGGPLHGKEFDEKEEVHHVIFPVVPTDRHPKQQRRHGFQQAVYEFRTLRREDGTYERVLMFVSGYYDACR